MAPQRPYANLYPNTFSVNPFTFISQEKSQQGVRTPWNPLFPSPATCYLNKIQFNNRRKIKELREMGRWCNLKKFEVQRKYQPDRLLGNFIYQQSSGSYRFWWKALDDEDLSIVLAYVYVHSLIKLCSELDFGIFVEFGACTALRAMEKVEELTGACNLHCH